MTIFLDLKPLSINHAYRGRRFDTPAKRQYDRALSLLLPKRHVEGPYYRIDYRFYLKNFKMTDQQNLLKCLTDAIVARGIITDDRFIVEEHIYKYQSDKDRMEIMIAGVAI